MKIVTTWWFPLLRLVIASTISSWKCSALISSYSLTSVSSFNKNSCLSLISPPMTPLNLSHYCLVILYVIILSLALLVLPPPLPRLQDGPLVHGFSLVKVCKVLYSLVGHTLHLLFIFLSLLNSTESFLLDPVFPGVFLTMTKLLLATFSVQFCDWFPYDVHIGFFMLNFLSCRDG